MTAAMFVATAVNFLFFSLTIGNKITGFIIFVRKALILDIDYPLSEKRVLVNNAMRSVNIVADWATVFPVSIKLLLPDPISIHAW